MRPKYFNPHSNRLPFVSGDEYDYLTRWRHVMCNNHQAQKHVKKAHNKRWRRRCRMYIQNREYERE